MNMNEAEKLALEAEKAAQEIVGTTSTYTPLDTVLERFPDGVTVTGCTTIILRNGPLACFTIKEDEILVPAGSGDLKKLIESWIAQMNGDFGKINEMLNKVHFFIKIAKVPQKKYPKPYTKIVSIKRLKPNESN